MESKAYYILNKKLYESKVKLTKEPWRIYSRINKNKVSRVQYGFVYITSKKYKKKYLEKYGKVKVIHPPTKDDFFL